MRKELVLGLVVVAALAGRAPAQTASTILGGPAPQNLQFKAVDVSKTVVPTPALAAQQNRFNFSALFNKNAVPSGQKVRGVSALPEPSKFPFYKSFEMVGIPPFLLGGKKTSPIQPMKPIIPSTKTPVGPGSN